MTTGKSGSVKYMKNSIYNMKATIRIVLCAAVAMMAFISCQKNADSANPAEESKGTIDIRIGGLMGEYSQVDGTKAELVNTVRVSWKGGETVYVYGGATLLGSLTAALESDEDRYALLSGTITAPASGTTLTLIYSPLLDAEPTVSSNAISISLANQDSAKAPFVVFATLDYSGATTITDAVVPFKFATSVIRVNCTGLKANTAIASATLSNVNTACKLTLSGTDAPTITGDANGKIVRTGDSYFAADKVNAEGEAVFQIAVPKLETASEARVLTVIHDTEGFKDKKFTKNSLNPATSVNTVCQMVALPAGALPGEFTVDPEGTKVHFSKGNLTYNVSTTTWTLYDHQYDCATGYDSNLISLFTWGYGTWSTSPNGTDYQTGDFTDWGSQIGDGNTWRTLSTAEWQYLFNYGDYTSDVRNGKYKWATVNGVGGFVIAPDDFTGTLQDTYANDAALAEHNLVFLPAAGARDGSEVGTVGSRGFYWSSTAFDEGKAYNVAFQSGPVLPDFRGSRSNGFSVRLITESK